MRPVLSAPSGGTPPQADRQRSQPAGAQSVDPSAGVHPGAFLQGRAKRWLAGTAILLGAAIVLALWISRPPDPGRFQTMEPLPNADAAADPYASVALSPDGSMLARGGSYGLVELFDGRSGKLKCQLGTHDGKKVGAVAFSWDGRTLASGDDDKRVRLWNVGEGKTLGAPLLGADADASIQCLAFSPDGMKLAAWERATVENDHAHGGKLRLWDTRSGQPLTAPESDLNGNVLALAFSGDGKWLVIGGEDERVMVWNLQDLNEKPTAFRGFGDARVLALAVSADGSAFAAGLSDRTVRLWQRTEAEPMLTLPAAGGAVLAVWLSADARVLASVDDTGNVQSCDTRGGAGRALLRQARAATAAAFSRDGRTVASAGHDGTLNAWRGR
jgi:WD40 repeat protein